MKKEYGEPTITVISLIADVNLANSISSTGPTYDPNDDEGWTPDIGVKPK